MFLRTLRNALFGATVGLAAVVVPQVAEATSLAELSVEQMTDASTYIVRGTVTAVWTELDDHGKVWTRATLDVSQTFKGPDSPQELTIDALGGIHNGSAMIVHGTPRFSEGEDMLVFLDRIRGGERLTPVSMFMGKYTVRRAPGDDRESLVRWHGRALEHYDARFLPHAQHSNRVYLDDIQSRVEMRVTQGWDGMPIPGISLDKLATINSVDLGLAQ